MLKNDSEAIIVQCKQWKVFTVGVKEIRELLGIMVAEGANRAIFVTSGLYTREAKRFAAGKPLELIDGEALSRLIAPIDRANQNIKEAADVREANAGAPACPVCQTAMVVRTAKRGANAGAQFWGCPKYPRCKGTRQI
jgi:restriction system protein